MRYFVDAVVIRIDKVFTRIEEFFNDDWNT